MIRIESAHIEELRGIRKLDLDFRNETFAISGPNGSGKSGVVDAIEFGLTGEIGRLSGRGTRGLSVAEHGPHVDRTKFPDAAYVSLRVQLTKLGKSATITRRLSSPRKPTIEPDEPDVRAVFAEIAEHPEITLSRRDILRFILVEPTTRSAEIQTLLKLEEIGQTRNALNAAVNKLQAAYRATVARAESNRTALQLYLQVPELTTETILEAINKRRQVLGLLDVADLAPDAGLDAGMSKPADAFEFNKEAALRELKVLADAAKAFPDIGAAEAAAIIVDLARLEDDPALLAALKRHAFIAKGLDLVDGPECPLCDVAWEDEKRLREHLQLKLAKSDQARDLEASLRNNGGALAQEIVRLTIQLTSIRGLAERVDHSGYADLLDAWITDLEALKFETNSVEGLSRTKERLTGQWLATPSEFLIGLQALRTTVDERPDQTATLAAQTFLTTAQLRFDDYRVAVRGSKSAELTWATAKKTYDTYCAVLEAELNSLYAEVEGDFSVYYRAINGTDEARFTAKLTPSEGKLDLSVNFYERGLFPPGAYHSEGHQDGMGVCLYLALMKRLLGAEFTFALLDDVVMSVDAGHRYEFCKLLKAHFPETQFIITTHDRLWAEQMRSAGLVTAKTSIVFHSWTVDTGPLVESAQEIWEEIESVLAKGKVEVAAAALRHHLEYVSRHLSDQLGAAPQFRADGNYELGELLPAVLTRTKSLYGTAADAAQSWGNTAAKSDIATRKASLASLSSVSNVEQWAVNKAVHYNEWANFGRTDFAPVVMSFRQLLNCFRCDVCDSWLYVTPRGHQPESLRCACNAISLNLKRKPK